MKIKVKDQINVQIEKKTKLITNRIAIREVKNFDIEINYGATLLSVDYDKQTETVSLLFAANPSRAKNEKISFIILNEGDFLPEGDWKIIKTLTSNFTSTKRYLFADAS